VNRTEGLGHVGIAVRNIDSALGFFRDRLGLELIGLEALPEQGVRVAALALGPTTLELLEPLSDGSPVGRFLASRGEGLHHLSFSVSDLEQALREAEAAGIRLVDRVPRKGAGGDLIAFLHPQSTHGVLVELSQKGTGRA
jgi:methylmalonyl-CoA epimerase